MQRIATNQSNDDMQYYARMREALLNRTQNQIASQSRLQELRDDPSAAAHATRHASYLYRLERYADNIEYAQNRHRETEAYVQEAVDLVQRARELAIQGANGTYSQDDRMAIATEINQLLVQLVDTANARGADGTMLFAGDRTQTTPFRAIEARSAGFEEPVISQVQYLGTITRNQTEIADGSYLALNFPGNQVFWAEDQQVYGSVDTTSFVVQADTSIMIDNTEIPLRQGDNIYAIVARINDAGVAVRARVDSVNNGLVLETTTPHQIWLDESGDVLKQFGILSDTGDAPPHNVASSARVFGGSVFDMMITLRDQLVAGDVVDIGGRALGGIDSALTGLNRRLGEIGSFDQHLQIAYQRTESTIPEITQRYSNNVDVDMTEAITRLQLLEFTHQAALGAAARVIQPTLLDFLR
jgi:flagellar hook-associated protein 3 FlgL